MFEIVYAKFVGHLLEMEKQEMHLILLHSCDLFERSDVDALFLLKMQGTCNKYSSQAPVMYIKW